MEQKEFFLKTVLFYPFRLMASFMSALSMNDQGLSLKKILATYSTWEAAQITNKKIAPNNVIVLVLIWLVYAGILVGIYSISDISSAVKQIKGNENTKTDNTNPPS